MSVRLRRYFPFLMGVMAIWLILLATSSYGIGISPDSVSYISVARNLTAGNGFTSFDNTPVVLWPPLFPILLALVQVFGGVDPQDGARVLNAVLFGLMVLLSSWWLVRNIRFQLALLGGVTALIAPPLIDISTMAWTEPLFILLVILFLIILQSYLSGNQRRHLFILTTIAALACLTRYIGYVLIIVGTISILGRRRTPIKRKLADTAIFAFCSTLPIGVWLTRNLLVSETLFGPRTPSPYSYWENIVAGYRSVFRWVFPERFWQYNIALLGLAVVFLITAVVCSWSPVRARLRVNKLNRNALFVPALFVAVYVISLVVSSTTVQQKIDARYLSPIFIPLLFSALFVVDDWLDIVSVRGLGIPARIVAAGGIALWLVVIPVRDALLLIENKLTNGAGSYSSTRFRESDTVTWVAELLQEEPDAALYSNRPDALYILGDAASRWVPSKRSYSLHEMTGIHGAWPEVSPGYLVWFDDSRVYLYTPEELKSIAEVTLFADLADGNIYTISRVE